MPTITVSTAVLREKARRIRTLADERLTQHRMLWTQMNVTKNSLPSDLRSSHEQANDSWHQSVETHYKNYYQLATQMELAADLYDRNEQGTGNSFQ